MPKMFGAYGLNPYICSTNKPKHKPTPMIYIALDTPATMRLPFYLAMEEYVARQVYKGEDCFFMWQVAPTVIFGRNQVIDDEVNINYCKAHHIEFYRRKSGGGCVYADMGNVMLSYITGQESVSDCFAHYMRLLTSALNAIGIPARRNDHNDIMLRGQKISGNAMLRLPDRVIAHGTLLYDTDMDHMTHAITPSQQKLSRNGVKSVRQRITLLKDFTPLSLSDVKAQLRATICSSTITLGPQDRAAIGEIEREYLDPAFIYGKHP